LAVIFIILCTSNTFIRNARHIVPSVMTYMFICQTSELYESCIKYYQVFNSLLHDIFTLNYNKLTTIYTVFEA